jgi:RNA polymerase sigma-70 factor (ECF subfamily)
MHLLLDRQPPDASLELEMDEVDEVDDAGDVERAADSPASPLPVAGRSADGRAPSLSPSEKVRLRAMMTTHFNFIWRSLKRLGVPHGDVDDCAQQVFLVASRKLAVIATGSEQAFLFGTALNVAAEARRTAARRKDTPAGDSLEAFDPGPQPDEIADRKRVRALLDKVLEAMPMDLRVSFVLFELEEMPLHQIASLLSIPTGTVASRLRRARAEFQRLVARMNASGNPRGVKR